MLGEQLAARRKAAGLSQQDLARATLRDRTTVAHIERGRARADEPFWQTADESTRAQGALVAGFRSVQEKKYEHDNRKLELEKVELASKIASSRTPGSETDAGQLTPRNRSSSRTAWTVSSI